MSGIVSALRPGAPSACHSSLDQCGRAPCVCGVNRIDVLRSRPVPARDRASAGAARGGAVRRATRVVVERLVRRTTRFGRLEAAGGRDAPSAGSGARPVRPIRSGRRGRFAPTPPADGEAGAATAEYAIATMAAVAFASALVAIMRSDEVRGILEGLVRDALTVAP